MRRVWTSSTLVKLGPEVQKSTHGHLSDHWVASGLQEDVREVHMNLEPKKHILTSQLGHGRNVYAIR